MMLNQKKHCIVVTCFDENQPGFLDFSYRIKALEKNYKLTVISTFKISQTELLLPNVNYVVIKSKKSRLGWFLYLWQSANIIRQQQPNVAVLLHSMVAPVALLLNSISTATYWNEHPTHVAPAPLNFSPIKTLSRWLIRWFMYQGARRSSVVMPIGEAHMADLKAHQCNSASIQMLYMGVGQSFYQVSLTGLNMAISKHLKLLYVGSVHKDRGRDIMLEAIMIANKDEKIAHLTLVGVSQEQMKYCQDAIKRLGIENEITLVGRIPGNDIPGFMENADMGLCLWENLPWYRFNPPTKLFEYLVAGLPVMASNIVTHTQYIEHKINGVIFEYNSESLASAITQLWKNNVELAAMKKSANDGSKGYLWNNIEPTFVKTIESILK